jgi:hypothetical protein
MTSGQTYVKLECHVFGCHWRLVRQCLGEESPSEIDQAEPLAGEPPVAPRALRGLFAGLCLRLLEISQHRGANVVSHPPSCVLHITAAQG